MDKLEHLPEWAKRVLKQRDFALRFTDDESDVATLCTIAILDLQNFAEALDRAIKALKFCARPPAGHWADEGIKFEAGSAFAEIEEMGA